MWLLENVRVCLERCWTALLLVILRGLFTDHLLSTQGYVAWGTRVSIGKEPPNMKKQPLLSLN